MSVRSDPTAAAAPDDVAGVRRALARLAGLDLLQGERRPAAARHVPASPGRRGAAGLDAFLDRVTPGDPPLWRNPEQWLALGRDLLPGLVLAHRPPRLRAWSAGAAHGAEAYTLAAVARAAVPAAHLEVVGTDADPRCVERARLGWFSAADARHVPRAALEQHFAPAGDGWQASPELLAACRFETGDLLGGRPPSAHFDLVLCRGAAAALAEEARDALHARLAAVLRPGGLLVVGAAERVRAPHEHGLAPLGPSVLRREQQPDEARPRRAEVTT